METEHRRSHRVEPHRVGQSAETSREMHRGHRQAEYRMEVREDRDSREVVREDRDSREVVREEHRVEHPSVFLIIRL